MNHVKTAISIEKDVFQEMNILAKSLKVSRSELFAKAAKEFIEKRTNRRILKQLNDVYGEPPSKEEKQLQKVFLKKSLKVVDPW